MPTSALSTVASHRSLVGGVVLTAIVGSGAVLALRPPTYEAVARVVVNPLSREAAPASIPVFRELGEPIRTIETASALLYTRSAADLTAQRLGAPWTSELVFRAVRVEPHGQTNLVDVIARADEPDTSARVANEYLTAILEQRTGAVRQAAAQALGEPVDVTAGRSGEDLTAFLVQLRDIGDPSSSVVETASVPLEPAGLSPLTVFVLSIVAGLLVQLALVTALADRARGRAPHSPLDIRHRALVGDSPSGNGRTYAPVGRSGRDTS